MGEGRAGLGHAGGGGCSAHVEGPCGARVAQVLRCSLGLGLEKALVQDGGCWGRRRRLGAGPAAGGQGAPSNLQCVSLRSWGVTGPPGETC